MRFLERNTNGEFSLTNNFTRNIPRYAILSHTWGADVEEVTFEDLKESTGKSKAGYNKIRFCGEQARRDGLQFFWVDTCCIDKSSSAELTEAINSMFCWYQDAAKCYVYLSDVSKSDCYENESLPLPMWTSDFRESVWFTRGWTLQELIAPASVEFFSSEGKRLGDKRLLERQVHDITGIALEALRGHPLSEFGVTERMSWASKRKTTRIEDEAYCLLGIFDIHMPLIYGEREKAMTRLKEEIDKSIKIPMTGHPEILPESSIAISSRRALEFVDRGTIINQINHTYAVLGSTEFSPIAREALIENLTLGQEPGKTRIVQKVETRRAICNWLNAKRTDHYYNKLFSARLDGTCDWILHKPVYLDWESLEFPSDTAKFLWINGPPGFGKTVLCASLVKRLATIPTIPLAFFFSSDESGLAHDAIVRSWVTQLVTSNQYAFECAQKQLETAEAPVASPNDIWELFKSIVSSVPGCTFVMDGLDEFIRMEDERRSCETDSLEDFIRKLKLSVAQSTSRVLIVSRDEVRIRSGLCSKNIGPLALTVLECKISREDVQSDITAFAKSVVDRKLPKKDQSTKDELSAQLAGKADGMFLWIKMQEQGLRGGKNKRQLEETINNMPTGLTPTYDRSWTIIAQQPTADRDRAVAILRWATFALKPLTVLEITDALIVKDEDDCNDLSVDELPDTVDEEYVSSEIAGLCGFLLEIRALSSLQPFGSRTVHLVHYSVKEYLCTVIPKTGLKIHKVPFSDQASQHGHLARSCIRYLRYDKTWKRQTSPDHRDYRPFLDYAVRSWNVHRFSANDNEENLSSLVNKFLSYKNPKWHLWRKHFETSVDPQCLDIVSPDQDPAGPLYYASLFGIFESVQLLGSISESELNSVGGKYGTALQAACAKGHMAIVKFLLSCDSDIDVQGGRHGSAVNAAAASGYLSITSYLIDKGANLQFQDPKQRTIVYQASLHGHDKIVALLLEKGVEYCIPNYGGLTPLGAAASRGYPEVVMKLLDRGADMAVATNDGWTPLNCAASNGHAEVVRQLLDRGADMTVATINGWTPLNCAASNGHVEVVKQLLERGRADMIEGLDSLGAALAKSFDAETMALLITAEVVQAVAGKNGSGKEVMTLLFKQRPDEVKTIDSLVVALLGPSYPATMNVLAELANMLEEMGDSSNSHCSLLRQWASTLQTDKGCLWPSHLSSDRAIRGFLDTLLEFYKVLTKKKLDACNSWEEKLLRIHITSLSQDVSECGSHLKALRPVEWTQLGYALELVGRITTHLVISLPPRQLRGLHSQSGMQAIATIEKVCPPFQFDRTIPPESLAYLAWTSFQSQNYLKSECVATYLLQEVKLAAWQGGTSWHIPRLELLLVHSLVHQSNLQKAKCFIEERIRQREVENLQVPLIQHLRDLKSAIEMWAIEEALGPKHKTLLRAFHTLGMRYADHGILDEAEKMYMRMLRGVKDAVELEKVYTEELRGCKEAVAKKTLVSGVYFGETMELSWAVARWKLPPNFAKDSEAVYLYYEIGDVISVLKKDSSGWWFASRANGNVKGWIAPELFIDLQPTAGLGHA